VLNVAIYAVVRCKVLVEGSLQSTLPSNMLMGFGLLSVVLAAFFLWRQRDISGCSRTRRSSTWHRHVRVRHGRRRGELRRAAAHDGALADQVGDLLRGGHAAQKAGSQRIEDIRGLLAMNPTIGWD